MPQQIGPQEGFQTEVMQCAADVAIIGGSAGGGKTAVMLMDAVRWHFVPDYGAVIFRRTYGQITQDDGLWDQSQLFFPPLGGAPNETSLRWNFPEGSRVSFLHLQHEKDLIIYQGAAWAFLGIDELTHFNRKEFFYLLSRNRSTCGVTPVVRASCNPDPESWVAEFIEWYIDQETGFPIPERAGVIRYFTKDGDTIVWGDSKQEIIEKCPHLFSDENLVKNNIKPEDLVRSFTFIPGSVYENKKLLEKDPTYLGNLMAQDESEKNRLLHGNWKAGASNQDLFLKHLIDNSFTSIIPEPNNKLYLTCDHARFGRDLCVIVTWRGWRTLRIDILPMSDTNDVVKVILRCRTIWRPLPASQMIVDQDGIGVKDYFQCHLFQSGATATPPPPSKTPGAVQNPTPEYQNKRAQVYYKFSEMMEQNLVHIDLNEIYLWTKGPNNGQLLEPIRVSEIKIKGKTHQIKQLITDDLRSVRRFKKDNEGKKRITPKEQQKNVLGGRSPDFGDALAMRAEFEYLSLPRYIVKK